MAKLFLRSGSLDVVLPLGENGHPLYQSALQLREALRLKKQQHIADCLAIPQLNEAGDRLDWYSPVTGKIRSWVAASENERRHAISRLRACQLAVAEICYKAQQSEKNNQKLFGALLANVLQFPDQTFVYLVDGEPVLTFWGFIHLQKPFHQDALDCLHIQDEGPVVHNVRPLAAAAPVVPFLLSAPAAIAEPPSETPPVLHALANTGLTTSESDATLTVPGTKISLIRYGWILPVAALLLALGMQFKGYLPRSASVKRPAQPVMQGPTPTSAEAAPKVRPVVKTVAPSAVAPMISKAPAMTIMLPLAAASVTPVPAAIETVPTIVKQATAAAALPPASVVPSAAKDDLVMPATQIKHGSISFLNGRWRVRVAGKSPLTGRPPILHYQLKNGKGSVRMTQNDGVSCRAEVYAGLMKSGNLVIKTHQKSRCNGGSHYQMPDLLCRQGAIGAAVCRGQYDVNTVLPVTIKRESK